MVLVPKVSSQQTPRVPGDPTVRNTARTSMSVPNGAAAVSGLANTGHIANFVTYNTSIACPFTAKFALVMPSYSIPQMLGPYVAPIHATAKRHRH